MVAAPIAVHASTPTSSAVDTGPCSPWRTVPNPNEYGLDSSNLAAYMAGQCAAHRAPLLIIEPARNSYRLCCDSEDERGLMRAGPTTVIASTMLLLAYGCGSGDADPAAQTSVAPTATVTATQRVTVPTTVRATVTVTTTRSITPKPPEPSPSTDVLGVTKEFLAETDMPSAAIVAARLPGSELDVLTTYAPE